MLTGIDKTINRVLLKNKIITLDKSEQLVQSASKEDKTLLDIVLEKKIIGEAELLSYLSLESGIPPITLDKIAFDEKVTPIVPEKKALEYSIMPIAKIGNILTIALSDPFDVVKLDDIRILSQCDLKLVLTLSNKLKEAIAKAYHPDENKMEEMMQDMATEDTELDLSQAKVDTEEKLDLAELSAEAESSPVIKLVNMFLLKAVDENASDIHIEPYERRVVVRLRNDGVLHESFAPPKKLHNAVVSRIKILAHMDIAERQMSQDGKFQIKKGDKKIDVRVSIIPTVHGERVVMRILDSSILSLTMKDLGFEKHEYDMFERAISASYGMVLISGPTGSGKTTTLYCALKAIFSPDDNIITVEDPVEYQLPGVIQVPVNVKQNMTFAAALRSILRQDPDIIMIGEMRDFETADIGVKAAITGHLVFSTLHTNDSISTVSRLMDMGIDPFMISSAILLVANQRLVRKLCPNCKAPVKITPKRLSEAGLTPDEINQAKLFGPVGCSRCTNGFKGRAALYEVLEIDDELKRLIINETSPLEMKKYAIEKMGLTTLRRGGIIKALKGEVSLDEVTKNT